MSNGIFGISEKALQLCEDRGVMIANNLVNSSTPHYKAKDINFQETLQGINIDNGLEATHSMHITSLNELSGEKLMYRIPMQTSLDGNTVDAEIERKNFIENALRYQVNLTFVKNKSEELMKAIRGD